MKKVFKKITAAALSALLACSAVGVASAASNDLVVDGDSMYNDYVKISVDSDSARLRMKTTGGNPDNANDDDKKMLFGSEGSTSISLVYVDGEVSSYNSNNNVFDVSKKTAESSETFADGNILVNQNYTFVRSNATGRDDMIEIKYTVANNDTAAHEVGIRIMIDTMLGDNDKAPFRVPNVGAVTTETTFSGSAIPEYYQAFDSLDNPTVVSFGYFDKTSSNKADYVQFMKWSRSYNREWGITTIDGQEIGDSSVASVWEAKALQPGETRTYKMYYGLGSFVADTTSELQLAGYGENTATVNDEGTGYNTSSVTAYIKNAGDNALENVVVNLNTVDGMTLADGQQNVSVGNIAAGEEKQISWSVDFTPVNPEATINYSITASADNSESKTVYLSTILPAIEGAEPIATQPATEEPTTVEPTTVEPTTAEPTTIAPTTVPDVTSATEAVSTNDTATDNPATVDTPDGNAIQTGSIPMSIVILAILMAATGVAYAYRKREEI